MHDNYKDREEEIEKILNKHSNYFLKGQLDPYESSPTSFFRNWIGIKNVGQKYPDQTIKMNLNSMSNYLVNSTDYLIKSEVNELIGLERMMKNDDKYQMTDRHRELRKKCLYIDVPRYKNVEPIIFMINERYENEVLRYGTPQQKEIYKIKKSTVSTRDKIIQLNKSSRLLKDNIRVDYRKLRSGDKNVLVSDIVEMSKKLKSNHQKVRYYKQHIKDLIDSYLSLTNQFFI